MSDESGLEMLSPTEGGNQHFKGQKSTTHRPERVHQPKKNYQHFKLLKIAFKMSKICNISVFAVYFNPTTLPSFAMLFTCRFALNVQAAFDWTFLEKSAYGTWRQTFCTKTCHCQRKRARGGRYNKSRSVLIILILLHTIQRSGRKEFYFMNFTSNTFLIYCSC